MTGDVHQGGTSIAKARGKAQNDVNRPAENTVDCSEERVVPTGIAVCDVDGAYWLPVTPEPRVGRTGSNGGAYGYLC